MSIQSNFPAIKPSLLLDFASVKALDPRITFSRASTGTFYGTQTAMAEQNLLLQSQALGNGSVWDASTGNVTVTSETETAPDGTLTAETLAAAQANAFILQYTTAIAADYTFSIWLKRKTGTGDVQLRSVTGAFTTVAVTSSWQRFSVTATATAGAFKQNGIRLVTNGDEVYAWGAQLEQRSTATAYTATTTQPITNYIPVLQTAASGVARFDHNPITDESLGLLIEEQRSNLLTYSEQFDNAAWPVTLLNKLSNTAIAPDGSLAADTVVPTAVVGGHFLSQLLNATSGTTYTLSVFAKAGGYSWLRLSFGADAFPAGGRSASFNLATGTVGVTQSGVTARIQSVGNGWFRCSIAVAATATASTNAAFTVNNADDAGATSFAGDGYSGLFLWGAQLEAGAFPTSYIQTVASQVTRAADAASMTGANFSSWYNQAEGTLYGEWSAPNTETTTRIAAGVSDGTTSNWILLGEAATNRTNSEVYVSGVAQCSFTSAVANTPGKAAFAYKVNDFAASTNGLLDGTDAVGTIPVVSQLNIGDRPTGARQINGTIRKLAYYPIRVTNAQLQALTS